MLNFKTSLEGLSFYGKAISCLAGSPHFYSSLWYSYSIVEISLAFYTLVTIIKHCWTSSWSPCISLTLFLIRNQTKRCRVEIIASNLLNLGCPRMILYAEGTWTTMKVRWTILHRGGVLGVTRRVILPSISTEFIGEPTKGVETFFSWSLDKFIQTKHHKIIHLLNIFIL